MQANRRPFRTQLPFCESHLRQPTRSQSLDRCSSFRIEYIRIANRLDTKGDRARFDRSSVFPSPQLLQDRF
jgi:hypothetical protein